MNAAATPPLRVAVIGAGWAGLAAAVEAVRAGHAVTVFEAARQAGGRARALELALPEGGAATVDNGQHILIGAYDESLRLMRTLGLDPDAVLLRQPLALRFADGSGLHLPDWPPPWNAAWGLLRARGWRWPERLALLRAALGWRRTGFACTPQTTVEMLAADLPQRLVREFIEPLCVAALNTPIDQASGAVFLRVLRDALLGGRGSSDLLLPRVDLGALLPQPALRWLADRGAPVHLGVRVAALQWQAPHWQVEGQAFDRVLCATAAPHAAQLVAQSAASAPAPVATRMTRWSTEAAGLAHRPITTVYAQAAARPGSRHLLATPMLALRSTAAAPAQFVFERDAIAATGARTGLLAFVISDSRGERAALQAAVAAQAREQLGLVVQPLLTVTERRATFACSAGLQRPATAIAPGLLACGDYVDGPYPATLEGAVRSAVGAVQALRTAPG
jgi:squalene-associated FAD-dependent desaturase